MDFLYEAADLSISIIAFRRSGAEGCRRIMDISSYESFLTKR